MKGLFSGLRRFFGRKPSPAAHSRPPAGGDFARLSQSDPALCARYRDALAHFETALITADLGSLSSAAADLALLGGHVEARLSQGGRPAGRDVRKEETSS